MSPVDYEAWRKGYTPPTEHVLIHKLSLGELRVASGSQEPDREWWLVTRGDMPSRLGLAIFKLIAEWEDESQPADGALGRQSPAEGDKSRDEPNPPSQREV